MIQPTTQVPDIEHLIEWARAYRDASIREKDRQYVRIKAALEVVARTPAAWDASIRAICEAMEY